MTSRWSAVLSVGVLALVGCGGDDDGGGGGSSQDQVADMMIDVINNSEETAGVDVDEDCVREKLSDLSDDDAEKILAAGPDGEPEGLSASAETVGASIFDCIDLDFSSLTENG